MGLDELVPRWLKWKIILDWADQKALNGLAPISDIMAALMVASLQFPLASRHADWYRYCFTKILDQQGIEFDKSLRLEELDEYSMNLFNEMRRTLFHECSKDRTGAWTLFRDS